MGGTMRWAELRMCRFWAGGISSFPFSRAREYRLLRRLLLGNFSSFFEQLLSEFRATCGNPYPSLFNENHYRCFFAKRKRM